MPLIRLNNLRVVEAGYDYPQGLVELNFYKSIPLVYCSELRCVALDAVNKSQIVVITECFFVSSTICRTKLKTFEQLLREFWLPLCLAGLWTLYSNTNEQTHSLEQIIKDFGSSFFLISWIGGQILRVKKQIKVDASFDNMVTSFQRVIAKLDDVESTINDVTLGGDNFPIVELFKVKGPEKGGRLYITNTGTLPIYDISGFYVDSSNPINDPEEVNRFRLVTLPKGGIHEIRRGLRMDELNGVKILVTFSTRNNHYDQVLMMKYSDNTWYSAIETVLLPYNDIVFTSIDDGYPIDTELEHIKWSAIKNMKD